ncbi:MAG: hypothetical protein L6Q35_01630 [Phycisphaerales bacterium]|nr:hypothetical protein [Phycisphaerales bacterium]
MPGSDPARAVYERLGVRGRVALVVGLLAAVALVWWLSTLIWAMLLPAASTASAQADEKRRLAELEEKFAQQIAQFNGRTVFYVPAPPQDEPKAEEGPADDDGPAPPPATYGGPSIIATVNDTLWFNDGTRVKVGEKSGEVKVVSLRAPWEATLEWRGKEFVVPFFERDGVVLAKRSSGSAAESIESTAEPPPPPADAATDAGEAPKPADTPTPPATDPPAPDQPAPPPPPDGPPPGDSGGPPPPPPDEAPRGDENPPANQPAPPEEPKLSVREGTR